MSLTTALTDAQNAVSALANASAHLDLIRCEHAARGLACSGLLQAEADIERLLTGWTEQPKTDRPALHVPGLVDKLNELTAKAKAAADLPFPLDAPVHVYDGAQETPA